MKETEHMFSCYLSSLPKIIKQMKLKYTSKYEKYCLVQIDVPKGKEKYLITI